MGPGCLEGAERYGTPCRGCRKTGSLPQSYTLVIQSPHGRKTWTCDLCYMLIGHRPDFQRCAKLLNGNLAYDKYTFELHERPGIYLVGALAKMHLEHIGLTDKLCPDNQGVRYIEYIRNALQEAFRH